MRLYIDGQEEQLPQDWPLVLTSSSDGYQVRVRRLGRLIPLNEALVLQGLFATSSKAVNKTPTDGDGW